VCVRERVLRFPLWSRQRVIARALLSGGLRRRRRRARASERDDDEEARITVLTLGVGSFF
jgi:hypothetical protein